MSRALAAQTAAVTLRSAISGAPVSGAVLSLVGSDGRTMAEGLTLDDGRRILSAPVPGTYRVRVRRIGFLPFVSADIVLLAGHTTSVELELPAERVTLAAIHIRSSFKACGGGFAADQATSLAWDQIRTALAAALLTERDSLVVLDVRHYVTSERPSGDAFAVDIEDVGHSGAQPFGTAEPATLSRSGYVVHRVGETTYWAPDPRVLLSAEFEREHCFHLVSRRDSTGDQIGLAFAPTEDRDLPDIAGTMWVRRADDRLQELEFTYTNSNVPLGATKVGGDIAFAGLPWGVWYISRWSLRLPLQTPNPIDPSRPRFAGYRRVGGTAVPVGATAVLPLRLESAKAQVIVGARVTVRVIDQSSDSAIDGAVIELQHGAASRLSDSSGIARFPAVPQGTINIRVRQIGYQPVEAAMLVSGDSTNVTVALTPVPVPLKTVRITAARASAYLHAFEMRRRLGIGRFLDSTVFEKEGWRSLNTVLLTHFGGLTLVPIVTDENNQLDHPLDLEASGAMRLEASGPSGILKDTKPTCPIDIYLGGVPFTEDADAIPTEIVGGAELYDKASAPPEYRRPGKACKVLLIWTKPR